jgi:hypothetical protein
MLGEFRDPEQVAYLEETVNPWLQRLDVQNTNQWMARCPPPCWTSHTIEALAAPDHPETTNTFVYTVWASKEMSSPRLGLIVHAIQSVQGAGAEAVFLSPYKSERPYRAEIAPDVDRRMSDILRNHPSDAEYVELPLRYREGEPFAVDTDQLTAGGLAQALIYLGHAAARVHDN